MNRQLWLEPGLDPYDALRGTRVPRWVRSTARGRQLVIQARKRSPVDLARVLGVAPFRMAKALGCFLAATARLELAGSPGSPTADSIVEALRSTEGAIGAGRWGYEFDVQTRWAFYPAGSPNLIATTFVGQGFLEAGLVFARDDWIAEAESSAAFLVEEMLRREDGDAFFHYTPGSTSLIHNANLLGAGFVAAAAALTGHAEWLDLARSAAAVSVESQGADGSWPYGDESGLGWRDNFHTAYNLSGCLQVWLATGDEPCLRALHCGIRDWTRFFGEDGAPGYYRGRAEPFDIHSAGTAVDVAARLAMAGLETMDLAERVEAWTAANLLDGDTGATAYQKRGGTVDGRNFRRWGDAHHALGAAALAVLSLGQSTPVEAALMKMTRCSSAAIVSGRSL